MRAARCARCMRTRSRAVEDANYALIAKAIFELKGEAVYPDATFTLRLAFGTVNGYKLDGEAVPAFTTIGGAFEHAAPTATSPPTSFPRAGSTRERRQARPRNPASTSFPRPTSSAAIPAARW